MVFDHLDSEGRGEVSYEDVSLALSQLCRRGVVSFEQMVATGDRIWGILDRDKVMQRVSA